MSVKGGKIYTDSPILSIVDDCNKFGFSKTYILQLIFNKINDEARKRQKITDELSKVGE